MKDDLKAEIETTDRQEDAGSFSIDRRGIMKLAAGAALALGQGCRSRTDVAGPSSADAQNGEAGTPRPTPAPYSLWQEGDLKPHTGPGYKNTANRFAGNGPMDDTTRKIVEYVHRFGSSDVTSAAKREFDRTMIDSMAALIAGFEEDAPRVAARLAAHYFPAGELKSTILGYGVMANPEHATFANGVLVRQVDFDDCSPGSHFSTCIPVALAVGEAFHSTGSQVMEAIVLGYELMGAPQTGGETIAAAMMAGKLMGLDEDHLANALSIALVPHISLNKGVGALSMWKGVRESEMTKCGVWAAMLARDGMTGPPQPFEGKGGYWSLEGGVHGANFGGGNANGIRNPFAPWTLPIQSGRMWIENNWFKRRPAEGNSQGILQVIPQVRAWVKADEIASMQYDTSFGIWDEICDAPKWDPQNRQTADHSLPYMICRAIMDGDIYLDSFDEVKYKDPAAHALMEKMIFVPVPDWDGLGVGRLTITKKSGETRSFDSFEGVRVLAHKDYPYLSDDEIKAKFDRACAFKKVNNAQRDQAYKVWGNVSALRDIGDAIKTLAKFGQPKAL